MQAFIYALLFFFTEGAQAARAITTSDMTSTSPSATPTPTPSILFILETPPSPTTCGSSIISWYYSGPGDPMTLQVTNLGVSQNDPPPTTDTTLNTERSIPITPSAINLTLVTDIVPSTPSFFWSPVNVSEGWYVLVASIPTEQVSRTTAPFFVFTGTNTSCLVTPSSTIPTTTLSSSSTSIISTSTPSSVLSSSSSSSSSSHLGVILGVTLGAAVLVIAVVSIWVCISHKKRSRTTSIRISRDTVLQWKGLKSTDSRGSFAVQAPINRHQSSRSHLHSHPGSITNSIGPDFEDGIIIGGEKSSTQLNFNSSKDVFEGQQGVTLSTLPVLHQLPQRPRADRTYSPSSSISNLNDLSVNKPSVRTHRRPSESSSIYPPFPRDSQSIATPDMSKTHSFSSTFNSFEQTSLPPPPDVIANRDTKEMYRQSLGRKRKPVPVYNFPSEDQQPIPSPSTPTFAPPPPLAHELSHKSSFGPGGIEGQPLHYLIPDMPMPGNR